MICSNIFNCVFISIENLALTSCFCRRRKREYGAGVAMVRAAGSPPAHSDGTA